MKTPPSGPEAHPTYIKFIFRFRLDYFRLGRFKIFIVEVDTTP
jgi:hypothetical protein